MTPPIDVPRDQLLQVLRTRFGHREFRPGQQEIIRNLLDGHDVLAVLPTGAGKSLAYQLTSQFLHGLTIVVSPLLALIEDQLNTLSALGIASESLSSTQSDAENARALERAAGGEVKLLYVTPERLENAEIMRRIREQVSLFVVDEAHSISEWGHSFRPAYLNLRMAIEELGRPVILSLTATANTWVRRDIVEHLGMREPTVVVRGTDRPNLFLEVIPVDAKRQDRAILKQLFDGELAPQLPEPLREVMQGAGIIYTATTRAAQETAHWLREWGISADYYHGQRRKSDRERVQAAFMAGEVRVIAATNAFGLGVDRADVRFVIHRDIPPSVEEYYQEAGRAGRDGQLARCVLLYFPGDLGQAAFFAASAPLSVEDLERGRKSLLAVRNGRLRDLEAATDLSTTDLLRVVDLFESEGLLRVRRGRYQLRVDDFDVSSISLEREQRRRDYDRGRLEVMRTYAELRECRRRYILNYFGEDLPTERCERCDVDLTHARPSQPAPNRGDSRFAISDRVVHVSLGEGIVQRVTADALSVMFDKVGYKTLALDLVEAEHLLEKIA
ncbi:MAG: ATP-dependent DNA helicase RecQ [Chloroflexi bacterium]|nr:ATP-dependent DNA helicase RecQ [Chloroflexota bacterium]